jgi:ribosomal protein S18 acetylase RimI-like enzyme
VIGVRSLTDTDLGWKQESLARGWGSTLVARLGGVIDAMVLDGFVALVDGTPAGLLTYAIEDDVLEVVTIHSEVPGLGVGRALMDAARAKALESGVRRMWLITTNDNSRAFRFYQQWGMDLAALHHDGVTRSRALKPSIPLTGNDRVPIRHELEFELWLVP